jgi:hypothetical protein
LAKLRPISMKIFIIIKFSEAPLSIKVFCTLGRPIGILTMKGRFLSDSSVSGWSSGPNEMSTLDHLILLLGSIRWARLISRWSFFPYVLEVMDMFPLKITLISPICSSPSESARHWPTHRGSCGADAAGDGIFFRSKKVLHSSRSCPAVRRISHPFYASSGCRKCLFSFCSEDCLPRYPRSPRSL